MARPAPTVLFTCLALILFVHAPAQNGTLPPQELRVWNHGGIRLERIPRTNPLGRFLEGDVALDTEAKGISITWTGMASAAAAREFVEINYPLSFFPTAIARSSDDPMSFYIAGSSLQHPVLEKWTLNEYTLAEGTDLTGTKVSVLTPPSPRMNPLLIDPTIGSICCLAVNQWPAGGGGEEVWIFGWESRAVFVTDRRTGLKQERVSNSVVGGFRTIATQRHTVYGAVFVFTRRPWFTEPGSWAGSDDPNFVVLYDQNLDGVVDGNFDIPWSSWQTHALYTTGTFSD